MGSRYKFSKEEIGQIVTARKANKDKRAEAGLKALELRARGLQSEDVAKATGFHAAYITTLVRKYRQGGLEAIAGNHYGGNRRKRARFLHLLRNVQKKAKSLRSVGLKQPTRQR